MYSCRPTKNAPFGQKDSSVLNSNILPLEVRYVFHERVWSDVIYGWSLNFLILNLKFLLAVFGARKINTLCLMD